MVQGNMPEMSEKKAVRAEALAARRTMPADERRAADQALVDAAVELVRGRSIVAAYAPMPGEPGGSALLDALAATVPTVLLPVLRPDRDLDWTGYEGPDSLGGSGGLLREPGGPRLGLDAVTRAQIVLVPAVAVDRAGNRLGRGGGSFDRALARVHQGTPVVALLYEGELRATLPTQAHDRPVTAVLTPSGHHPISRPADAQPR